MRSTAPCRCATRGIKSVDDLRRAAALLSRQLGLPREPVIKVGRVPWKGPGTPIIELMGAKYGFFTVARWAVRGRYRRSWEALEYAMVCGIGFWLESHRRESIFRDTGTHEALMLWYGADHGPRPLQNVHPRAPPFRWPLL